MCVYVIWGSCVYVLYIFMYQKFKVEEGWGVWLCVCVCLFVVKGAEDCVLMCVGGGLLCPCV